MARLEIHRYIAAPANEVAAFLVPQRMPYWYGTEIDARFELSDGGADFLVGQKVRITGRVGRREVALTAVVMKFEFGRVLEWRFQDAAGVKGMQSWRISECENGASSRIIMRDKYEMPGAIGRLLDRLLTHRGVMKRDIDALARLARLAERK